MCFAEAAFQWHRAGAAHTGLELFCRGCGAAWCGFGGSRVSRSAGICWWASSRGMWTPWGPAQDGQEVGFHPRAQGQGWREEKLEKSSAQLPDRHLLSPCPEGPDKLVSLWQALLHTSQLRTRWRHLSELEALMQLQAPGSSGRWTSEGLIRVRDAPILQRNQFSLIIPLLLLALLVATHLGSSKQTQSPCAWATKAACAENFCVSVLSCLWPALPCTKQTYQKLLLSISLK